MLKLFLALFTLAACALPTTDHLPHEDAAYAAVAEAWAEAGMPEPSASCDLDRFVVHTGVDDVKVCGTKAYGCVELRHEGPPMRGVSVPHISIAAWYRSEPHIIVHELLHAFSTCAGVGGSSNHSNPAVWGADPAVQGRATAKLRAQGWLDE